MEPENYLDMIMTEWLPRQQVSEKYASALRELAQRFEQRHGDPWLSEALAAKPSQRRTEGLAALSEAVQANLTDDTDRALTRSHDAIGLLQRAGDSTGAVRAGLEEVYALYNAQLRKLTRKAKSNGRSK